LATFLIVAIPPAESQNPNQQHERKNFMKNFNSFLISNFVATVVLFIALPISISGAERRISRLTCVASPFFFDTGIINCPIIDDDVFPKWAVNVLNVHGRRNTRMTVSARACSEQFFSPNTLPTIFCGLTKTTGPGTGDFVLHFNSADLHDAWGPQHAADFGFVEILLSDSQGDVFITGLFLSSVVEP
jgi:hypothetical protein